MIDTTPLVNCFVPVRLFSDKMIVLGRAANSVLFNFTLKTDDDCFINVDAVLKVGEKEGVALYCTLTHQ